MRGERRICRRVCRVAFVLSLVVNCPRLSRECSPSSLTLSLLSDVILSVPPSPLPATTSLAPCCAASSGKYSSSLVDIEYDVVCDTGVTFRVSAEVSDENAAWIGIGFHAGSSALPAARMSNADIIMARLSVADATTAEVQAVLGPDGRNGAPTTPSTTTVTSVTGASSFVGGRLTLVFTRPLDGAVAIDAPVYVIAAANSGDRSFSARHDHRELVSATPLSFIQASEVVAAAQSSSVVLLAIHGALMAMAWAVSAPAAVFLGRFLKGTSFVREIASTSVRVCS